MNLRFFSFSLLLCGLTAVRCPAQSPDGFTVQKRAGIALIKPQAWSAPKEATVTEFQSFTDRTVKGPQGAGYVELYNQKGIKRQVAAGRIVELFVYPLPSDYPVIQEEAQRQALAQRIQKMQALANTYPATKTYLAKPLQDLTAEAALYDGGKIKVEGKWLPRTQRQREVARELAGQLKVEIVRAKPVRNFNYKEDPRFDSLTQLVASDATLDPLIKELEDFFEKTERNEERQALLQKLSSKETSLKAAQLAISTLKTLKPEEDPSCVAFLKLWDNSIGTHQQLTGQIETVIGSIEDSFKDLPVAQAPPALPDKVMQQIVALNKLIRDYRVTNPPPQLDVPAGPARALASFEIAFPTLHQQFDEKKLFAARETLDGFAPVATDIGPNTTKWTGELKEFLQAKTDVFGKLRDEAKLLANSGKPEEALAKYEEAYAVIPDPDVAQQIESLKAKP